MPEGSTTYAAARWTELGRVGKGSRTELGQSAGDRRTFGRVIRTVFGLTEHRLNSNG